MKRLILLLLLAPLLCAAASPYTIDQIPNPHLVDRTRYVSNPDAILTPQAVQRIDSICFSLRERGIAQVAVVAVDQIASGDVFSFAHSLFSSWGVGRAKDNNGLGVLLVTSEREVRFVTGYGVEGVLPDAICKRIQMEFMLPEFRRGDYSAGMVAGLMAISNVLNGSELDAGIADPSRSSEKLPAWMIFAIVLGFIVIPIAVSMISYYRSKRCPKCGKLGMEQQSQNTLSVTHAYQLTEYTYRCKFCGHTLKRQSKSMREDNLGGGVGGPFIGGMGGFGRGGSSGGGSFGGGSFGGGSFGGGGSGSRW